MPPRKAGIAAALVALAALTACAGGPGAPTAGMTQPIVIAHRGASGERPEHTLMAYRRAIAQGADFIEPDLVMTRDGVLVARHENEISETTDVADRAEFASRKRMQTIDGAAVTGWFTEDFTLAELKTLRARERLPRLRPGNVAFDGQEPVPTFAEVIILAQEEGRRRGFPVGIYPEIKHPEHFAKLGLPMEQALVETLAAFGLTRADDPVFVQCFEVGPLQRLNALTDVRLVQLISSEGGPADRADLAYARMLDESGLAAIAAYADGVGVHKDWVIPRDAAGALLTPSDLVARARAAGLFVHAWTFRSENFFLPAQYRTGALASDADAARRGDAVGELRAFYATGIDGVFADHPADAIAARAPPSP